MLKLVDSDFPFLLAFPQCIPDSNTINVLRVGAQRSLSETVKISKEGPHFNVS